MSQDIRWNKSICDSILCRTFLYHTIWKQIHVQDVPEIKCLDSLKKKTSLNELKWWMEGTTNRHIYIIVSTQITFPTPTHVMSSIFQLIQLFSVAWVDCWLSTSVITLKMPKALKFKMASCNQYPTRHFGQNLNTIYIGSMISKNERNLVVVLLLLSSFS